MLKEELKLKLIKALNLDGITAEDIDDKTPLFGDQGLGLDSIDVLELIVLLEKEYGIRITSPKDGKGIFSNVESMAEFIEKNRSK